MGILDKIGITKSDDKKDKKNEAKQEVVEKAETKKKSDEPDDKKDTRPSSKGTTKAHRAFRVLVKPVISEKAIQTAGRGTYVFEVAPRANKPEIKKAIERLYNVGVTDVRIVRMPSKVRRYGRTIGETPSWKKAYVTLKEGDTIAGIVESVG